MKIREFKELVFTKAKEEGFSEYEIYYSKKDGLNIEIYELEVDKYSVNTTMGVSFRGIFNGNMGYAFSEILDEEAANMLVEKAKENAVLIEKEEKEFIFGEKENYENIKCFNEELNETSVEKKIELALELEKEGKSADERIIKLAECSYAEESNEYGIMNSKGLDLYHKSNIAFSLLVPVVKNGEEMKNGFEYIFTSNLKDINPKDLAKSAAEDVLSKLNGDTIESGKYKVAIENRTMASLLSAFIYSFNGEDVQKGLSLLKDKLSETIASTIVNLVDDPLIEGGVKSRPFDDEGVPTYKKYLIKEGKLNTFMHNLSTANKAKVKTTGNAYRASYSSSVTVAPSNCYIEKGNVSKEDLIKEVKDGLLITELNGIHAGANAITGDFSLAASGFLIKDGKKDRPVEQITVAGNFFSLIKDIELIGEDLKFDFSMFGSPTVVVKELSVAGK
ncbi:TldD/PmbA family protein [Clostridium sp.]|uniref:TldD/PmbA family protein n=1 Tax=Clostridium sp. TaxID=1506 RepID=UPI0034646759